MPARSLVPSPHEVPGAPYIGLLGLAIATLLAASALAWPAINELDLIAEERAALNQYTENLRDLGSAIQSAATAGRGYAISGEARDLDAAIAAVRRATELGEQAATRGQRFAAPARFIPLHDGIDSLAARALRLQLAGPDGPRLAQSIVRSGDGTALLGSMSSSLDSLLADARARREGLVARADAARLRLAVWLPIIAATAIALAVLAVLLLRAQARARAQDLTRYRAIFDNTFQFTGLLALDGTLLEANKTALAFGGLTAESVLGRPFWEARWWASSEETRATLRDAIVRAARGEFVRYPVEVLGANDRRLTIDFSLKPVRDLTGAISYLVPEGRDISEQLAAERALEESEERWNFALSGSDLGVWDWNAVTNAVYFSDRWKSMLGYAPDEVGGTLDEWSKRVHPDDLAGAMATVQAHLEGRTPYYVSIHRMRAKDGGWRDILDRGKVVARAPDGRALRVIGTHQDITEQRAAEASARALQQQLSALLRHSPSLITVLDIDGRYLQASESVATATGRPVSELVGRRIEEVTAPETAAAIRQRIRQVMAANASIEVEDTVPGAEGPRHYRTVLFPMRNEKGDTFAIGVIALNVTEATVARQRLQQALDENRVLQGLLSICARCKRIHDKDAQDWKPVEAYVQDHSAAKFSHSLCPSCADAFAKESGLDAEGPSAP